ncbi:MAG: MotA/TolQ/ExbB proton channel family protein [Deltaproteobacteria bacterium]|nr:MAG: MotA/TolQ/ExbB proton channel family protein [Deltaproteobacteria bacterium]
MGPLVDLIDYLREGGPIMFPIVGVSLWMWALIARKTFQLWSLKPRDLTPEEVLACFSGERAEGKGLQDAFLILFSRIRGRVAEEEAVRIALRKEKEELEGGLRTIKTLAAIAPLLGLLGTVTGMITTFQAISLYGTGSPKALAVGISEALITTQSGLLVSIPGLFAAGVLSRRANKYYAELEEFSARFVANLPKGGA